LDKIAKFWEIISFNGGIRNSLFKMYRFDDLKIGKLVGTDKYGNKYYENNYYFYGRNRWVEYAPHIHMNYDGSQIPAEWFGWMHYKTDRIPTEDPHRPQYKWMTDHSENLSGTPDQYAAYSTVKPKIEAWQPPKKSS